MIRLNRGVNMADNLTTEPKTVSEKKLWSAPQVIEAKIATDSRNTVPFAGVDQYEAYFPSAGLPGAGS